MSFRAGNDNNNNKNFSKISFMLSPWGGFHRWRRTLFFKSSFPFLSERVIHSKLVEQRETFTHILRFSSRKCRVNSFLKLPAAFGVQVFFNVANSLGLESFFPLPTCYMKGLRLGNNCYGIVRVLIVSRSCIFFSRSEKLLSLFLEVEVLFTRVGWLLMVIK